MSEYTTATNFIDLRAQQDRIREEINKAIKKVLDHGQYIMGPEVKEFEKNLLDFTGSKNVITCANGTDALSLVLMAWGVSKGKAVFVPSFTYIATAETVAQLGAIPFFVDVDEKTFNIDPESLKTAILDAKKSGIDSGVVIAVDLFGLPSDIDSIMDIAENNNIKVLIDSAQSFGAFSKKRRVGTMGHATATSFFPAKPLGCYGDGGAVFCQDDDLAEKIRSISLHGKGSHKYENIRVGVNSRLDTIQAAILIEKLKIFQDELLKRQAVADNYLNLLNSELIQLPQNDMLHKSAWAQFTIQVDNRDKLQKELSNNNIPSIIYYPIPLSKQKAFKNALIVSSGLKISELLPKRVLSLPMHPYLTIQEIQMVSTAVNSFVDNS
tara:strand:+ start:99 stop:1241 length:1143 start_codon:yes stop_codon:yes gene_type:complete